MKKLSCYLFVCALLPLTASADAFKSCGAGYVLVENVKTVDGIRMDECQKLWCRDLETGKSMGSGNTPASGYKTTSVPEAMCDAAGNCIECFGARKWCNGEKAGEWNEQFGAYVLGDDETASSYQKGGCFGWRLDKPICDNGSVAMMSKGQWVCVKSGGVSTGSRAASVRRTGAVKRNKR